MSNRINRFGALFNKAPVVLAALVALSCLLGCKPSPGAQEAAEKYLFGPPIEIRAVHGGAGTFKNPQRVTIYDPATGETYQAERITQWSNRYENRH